MLSILVVDDEKIERDGIKFLLNKKWPDINIFEAENGVDAISVLEQEKIDIMCTDIKMPFMDGLDLSYAARKINPELIVVIFSAFDKFEYAKKAIDNSVLHYILKPVDPDEFYEVIGHSINICHERNEEKQKKQKLMEVYNKGLDYEKENILFDIINGATIDSSFLKYMKEVNLSFEDKTLRLIFIDTKHKFFDTHLEEFIDGMGKEGLFKFELLNLNEYQCLLFSDDSGEDKSALEFKGKKIIEIIDSFDKTGTCIIYGIPVKKIDEIYDEYRKMETVAETSLFFESGTIFFTDEKIPGKAGSISELTDKLKTDIFNALEAKDYQYACENMKKLFSIFKGEEKTAPLYIKYICAGIAEKLSGIFDGEGKNSFINNLENLYGENSLSDLKDYMEKLFEMAENVTAESGQRESSGNRKVIDSVLEIIEKEYNTDLSLDYIAEKVYLTPTYLSYLFKRETGYTLLKYVTTHRMNQACKLLLETNMRVVDICNKVGYSNLSYFCSIFKSYYKTTPAKFREAGH